MSFVNNPGSQVAEKDCLSAVGELARRGAGGPGRHIFRPLTTTAVSIRAPGSATPFQAMSEAQP